MDSRKQVKSFLVNKNQKSLTVRDKRGAMTLTRGKGFGIYVEVHR